MTAYEAAAEEKDKLYARIQLVREEIRREEDPARRREQKYRLKLLFDMYHESLDRLEALRPPQEKRHRTQPKKIIHTGTADFDMFERCKLTFADLEGNQVSWDDLEPDDEDSGENRARLLRALRRGRTIATPRQREMLDLYLQGKGVSEIAEQLHVRNSTVSRTLSRAKANFNRIEEDLRCEQQRQAANRLDLTDPETAKHVLSRLTETQAVYLYLYYGEWLDMRSIGALLGVSHSTVCRTIHRAAGRIRALCTDAQGAELRGVDALEPALYALYRQHAADELIPERAKAAARRASRSGCLSRPERRPESEIPSAPIWRQEKRRTAAQSRLLRELEAAMGRRTGAILARLQSLVRALRARMKKAA